MPLYIFLGWIVLRTMTAMDISTAIWGPYMNPFGSLVSILILLTVFETAAAQKPTTEDICRAVVMAGILISTFGVAEVNGFNPFGVQLLGGRAGTTIGNPVFMSGALMPVIPCALWLYRKKKETLRAILSVVLIIGFGLISTGSRGGLLATSIATLVFYLA